MTPITIPPAALEAAARALHAAWIDNNSTPDTRDEYREWKWLTDGEREDIMTEARAALAPPAQQEEAQ